MSIEDVLKEATTRLLQNGPADALEYLKDSEYVGTEPVVRRLHAIVWTHLQKIPEWLLAEAFLDPIWCQCDVCSSPWLIPPLYLYENAGQYQRPELGVQCSSCKRVFCATCTAIITKCSSCGGTFSPIARPNGRKRRTSSAAETPALDPWGLPTDEIAYVTKDIDLYFGFDGHVPIGIDTSFPSLQTASADAHLAWAEALVDLGLYYQAHEQLALLEQSGSSSPRAQWLRARLRLVQLHNLSEGLRRHRYDLYADYLIGQPALLVWPQEIKQRLDTATQQEPDFGTAWLTRAYVYLDPLCDQDVSQAYACAQRAQELLGSTPAVVLALGKTLRGLGRPADAVEALRQIASTAEEYAVAQQELEWAEFEVRCQSDPPDVEAHLLLGRRYIRQKRLDDAYTLFQRLKERYPDRAEGYYGLAQLAFLSHHTSPTQRHTVSYQLGREALDRDPHFGLAYELLGDIFRNLRFGLEQVNFPLEDPVSYYQRALQFDETCDSAFCHLAEDHIEKGSLEPALELLEKAAKLDTINASVYFYLAAIYRGKRRFEEEEWARRKAKELSPDTELTTEYQNKILDLCGYEV